jgi:hypothetical protein
MRGQVVIEGDKLVKMKADTRPGVLLSRHRFAGQERR